MADELNDALRHLLRRLATPVVGGGPEIEHMQLESRVARLESDVSEVRGRINGLLFVVVGAVLVQLVMKVMG